MSMIVPCLVALLLAFALFKKVEWKEIHHSGEDTPAENENN